MNSYNPKGPDQEPGLERRMLLAFALTFAVILLFLWQVHDILTPFIWAIVTAYVLNPVVVFLARRTGMPGVLRLFRPGIDFNGGASPGIDDRSKYLYLYQVINHQRTTPKIEAALE